MSPAARLLSLPVHGYRLLLSPWIGHSCRFQPTCSAYALEALERHGAVRGGRLVLSRLLRCHPWGGSGYDPVPPTSPDEDRAEESGSVQATDPARADRSRSP